MLVGVICGEVGLVWGLADDFIGDDAGCGLRGSILLLNLTILSGRARARCVARRPARRKLGRD
jgi:hypothetical protein